MTVDATDARLLLALAGSPRASVLALAERLGVSRNTVQARLARLERLYLESRRIVRVFFLDAPEV